MLVYRKTHIHCSSTSDLFVNSRRHSKRACPKYLRLYACFVRSGLVVCLPTCCAVVQWIATCRRCVRSGSNEPSFIEMASGLCKHALILAQSLFMFVQVLYEPNRSVYVCVFVCVVLQSEVAVQCVESNSKPLCSSISTSHAARVRNSFSLSYDYAGWSILRTPHHTHFDWALLLSRKQIDSKPPVEWRRSQTSWTDCGFTFIDHFGMASNETNRSNRTYSVGLTLLTASHHQSRWIDDPSQPSSEAFCTADCSEPDYLRILRVWVCDWFVR